METWLLTVVGQRVRQLRKQRGFSQEKLAELAGLHFTSISSVERADKNLSLTTLAKIADALEAPVYQLVMTSKEHKALSKTDQELTTAVSTLINKMKSKDLKKVYVFLTEILEIK